MVGRAPRRRFQLTATALVAALLFMAAPPARADGHCHYEGEPPRFVCEDGGSDDTPSGPTGPTWTAWRLIGTCGGAVTIGGGVIDITSGLVDAVRLLVDVDGVTVLDTQTVCIDLSDGENQAWNAIAQAVEALPDPEWHANPDDVVAPGLTGLETWIWYDQATGVGPVTATWTEPVTGLVFGVEGRGWTESLTWDTADGGAYDEFAATWDEHDGMGGTEADPPVRHTYRTKSSAAGFPAGYPVEVELLWVGEFRVAVAVGGGSVWTDWARFSSTLTELGTTGYEVIEVRSDLTG